MTKSETYPEEISKLINRHTKPMFSYPTDLKKSIIPLKGIRAVFFDVYGTMLISGTGDIGISEEKNNFFPISAILSENSFQLISAAENIDERFSILINELIKKQHKDMKSKGSDYPEVDIVEIWTEILTKMIKESYISGIIDEEKIKLAAVTYECMINPVWPMENLDKLITFLYSQNIKLGIISNAQFYTPKILKELINFQIDKEFFDPDLLFYSYKEKLAKPSKEFFLKAVRKVKELYNIDSYEILYIGNDMLNDVYTASQCGCKTALFAGDKRSLRLRLSDERCRDLKPDLIITDLKQLTDIL